MKILDIGPRLRLQLLRIRLSARLFCWTADHYPRLAEAWALRR